MMIGLPQTNKPVSRFKNTDAPLPQDWLLVGLVLVIFYFSYIYCDILYTTQHGINVWVTIEKGQFFNFYSYNYNILTSSLYYPSSAMYDFPIYIIFAVWDFPLWILERFFHIDIFTSFGCLLYMKAILLPFLFASAYTVRKICRQLGLSVNNSKWAVFLFLSSGFVFSSVFLLSQYDIISLLFMLIGISMYLQKNYKKFLLFFAIAISFKLFALMIFIPLLLLKEKKIIRLIGYVAASFSISVASKIPFLFDNGKKLSSFGAVWGKLTNNILPLGLTGIYVFIFAFVALCIFCYIKRVERDSEYKDYTIYLSLLSFSVFFLFTDAHPYWFVLLTPFTAIVLTKNVRYFKVNTLLDTFMTSSMIVLQQTYYHDGYGLKEIQLMLLPKLFGAVADMNKPLKINDIYTYFKISNYGQPLLNAVFMACLAALLILNFPRKSTKAYAPGLSENARERGVMWFRLLCGAGVCALPIGAYLFSILVYGLKR